VSLWKALFADAPVEPAGEHSRVGGYRGAPRPLQQPHPPLLIGGGGRRVLELAAREADVVSFNFDNRSGVLGPAGVRSGAAEATAQKIRWVREAAGARFASLELEIGAYFTFVGDSPEPLAAALGKTFGLSAEEMMAHPHALFGPCDAVCEELERRRETYGISYVTVGDTALEAFAPVVARLAGR
jgi:alkanesulfonate monooxygenase SsuD/methylene tetrahydromethanopterin reductase-like flavin-dependent oxidoreductase (luciferase family)